MKKKSVSKKVKIFEVGPRDGLQNEKTILSTANKAWLCQELVKSGLTEIEAGAFVRPDRVPQMADTDQLQEQLANEPIPFWYLVPNEKGLERALQKGVVRIALFTAVSETFNQRNIGMSVEDSLVEMEKVIGQARKANSKIKIRAYLSTVWGCPFEGRMDLKRSTVLIRRILKMKIDEISIGDTIGVANPTAVKEIFKKLKLNPTEKKKVAVHFHDTRGTALANALAAYDLGIRIFDSSVGGLGGCPFAPGASGNLATEDLIYMFKEMGIQTGVDYEKICKTSLELAKKMDGRKFNSKALQAFSVNSGKIGRASCRERVCLYV